MEFSEYRRSCGHLIASRKFDELKALVSHHMDYAARTVEVGIEHINSLLHGAIIQSETDEDAFGACKVLFEVGADANRSFYSQSSVGFLHTAAKRSLALTKLFVEHGAQINHDLFGKPACWALISAVCAGKLDIVQYLIEQGAVVNFVNIHGMSPLDYAPKGSAIHDYLLARGAVPGEQLPRDHLPSSQPGAAPAHQSICDHFKQFFAEVEPFPLYEVLPTLPEVRLWLIRDFDGRHAIVTDGMADYPANAPAGDEQALTLTEVLLVLLREYPLTPESLKNDDRARWPIDWLRRCARWPLEHQSYFREHTIIDNGDPPRPLGPGTPMKSLLLWAQELDYWSRWQRTDGSMVTVLTMVPLFDSERQFERDHGMELFMERWAEFGRCLYAPSRQPADLGEE